MRTLRYVSLIAALMLLAVGPAAAQFGRGAGPRMPNIRGVMNPVVGSGAVYQTSNGEMEISVVGKEDVNGKPGVWIQIGTNTPEGLTYIKQLIVMDGNKTTVTRMIMQPPKGDAMEMPPGMIPTPTTADAREGQLVGTESVVTPAGTFSTQHYKGADWDSWVASNVPVWGLVKSKDSNGEMTLLRTMTGVPDRIKGKVQTLDIPGLQIPVGNRGRGR